MRGKSAGSGEILRGVPPKVAVSAMLSAIRGVQPPVTAKKNAGSCPPALIRALRARIVCPSGSARSADYELVAHLLDVASVAGELLDELFFLGRANFA
jgi:hypothetical protein